jgi:hypothetical protein
MLDEVSRVPLILIEHNGARRIVSREELEREAAFWTVDSAFFQHASWLIKEVREEVTFRSLLSAIATESVGLPDGVIVCPTGALRYPGVLPDYQPAAVIGIVGERRLDLRWEPGESSRWYSAVRRRFSFAGAQFEEITRIIRRATQESRVGDRWQVSTPGIRVPCGQVEVDGLEEFCGVVRGGERFMLPGVAAVEALRSILQDSESGNSVDVLVALNLVSWVLDGMTEGEALTVCKEVRTLLGNEALLDWHAFGVALAALDKPLYDVTRWSRDQN